MLSSRMRTDSPEMVTRAIMRTVVFDTAFMPSPFCEVPQAVIHLSDAGGRCRATVPEPRSTARPATSALLESKVVVKRRRLRQDVSARGRESCCIRGANSPIISNLQEEFATCEWVSGARSLRSLRLPR